VAHDCEGPAGRQRIGDRQRVRRKGIKKCARCRHIEDRGRIAAHLRRGELAIRPDKRSAEIVECCCGVWKSVQAKN